MAATAALARWSGPPSTSGRAREQGRGAVRARRTRSAVAAAPPRPSPDAAPSEPPPPFAWTDDWAPVTPRPRPTLAFIDLRHALVPYEAARAAQHDLVAAVRAAREDEEDCGGGGSGGTSPPVGGAVLLLQHPPVYTLGAGATLDHLRFDPSGSGDSGLPPPPAPCVRVERGGEVTFHGPGQLVLYPILDLSTHFLPDLHWYMRALEQVVIECVWIEFFLCVSGVFFLFFFHLSHASKH